MPDPEKTRAKNEAVLFAEGFRVPFYKTTADGKYELDKDSHPVFVSGMAAPAFELSSAVQGSLGIGGTDGSSNYLLLFVPSIKSPNSLNQLRKLAGWNAELLAAGVKPVAIMGDPMQEITAAKEKYSISIPLLHDSGLEIATQYGCAIDGSTFAQRTFVGIKPDGTVAFFKRGFSFVGIKDILEAFGISTNGK